ncbi:MAG TPA: hypothetical protein PKC70_16035, partial [Cellvibrionaceae bacterium]|nr:hypothetical protein [Cellvibrionaceae bacterium]
RPTLKQQFGSLDDAKSAQAFESRMENRAVGGWVAASNDAQLSSFRTPSEGVESIFPEAYLLGIKDIALLAKVGVRLIADRQATDIAQRTIFATAKNISTRSRSSITGESASTYQNTFATESLERGSASHPLTGWSTSDVIEHANRLGLTTPRDSYALWSGLGPTGAEISQAYVKANGGITLGMTPGGKWLDTIGLSGPNSPFTRAETIKIWGGVSEAAAEQASGQVRALLGSVSLKSYYKTIETQTILANPNITGIEEIFLKPRFSSGE